jgi:hypothetical protein
MLPRPATIAAPPTTASPASWNPAVPPPPVTGAPLGTGVGDGLGEGSGLGLSDADGLAEALALSDELALALSLVLSLSLALELDEAVLVAVEVAPAEPLAVGRNVDGGGVVEGLEVQAESATQASMVVRPQPTTVSRTRCDVPAMEVRAFIEPPCVLGNDHFPVAGRRNRRRKGKRAAGLSSLTASAGKTSAALTASPGCATNRQWRAHHRNIRLCG